MYKVPLEKKKTCNLVVRVSESLRNDSKQILEQQDATVSKAFRVLLEYVVENKQLPNELSERIK